MKFYNHIICANPLPNPMYVPSCGDYGNIHLYAHAYCILTFYMYYEFMQLLCSLQWIK